MIESLHTSLSSSRQGKVNSSGRIVVELLKAHRNWVMSIQSKEAKPGSELLSVARAKSIAVEISSKNKIDRSGQQDHRNDRQRKYLPPPLIGHLGCAVFLDGVYGSPL